ncbi:MULTISPECIES: PilZ domain-containing protein [Novosphingobium]|uniref:PilZ domain-containing protein n=1 Tax=Novosphingobium mathurense TaxID=428990 RepID=A0A1U6GXU8_9SPHN|nr:MULTISPECIES: PilZ domain-containing protein [Novosphingobium]CDO34831.1 hypothetical protein SPHV1_210004 [Novosphingobium sp. KN65.2]SLJ88316.1 PilZ domain-containing protein [Novosphingobium mathurense]
MHHERITGSKRPHAQRSKRVGVTILCEVRQGTRPWKMARLEDLSPGGFRIAWFPEARPELPLRIRIPGMQLLTARICWERDSAIGCEFDAPLHIAVFEHIVQSNQTA